MNSRISRFVVAAAIAALVVVGGSTPLLAQVNFSPDFSTAVTTGGTPNLTVNGTATINGGTVLRLTQDLTGQAGSAWFTAQQPVAGGFSTTFKFQFTQDGAPHTPADGIAFVIQNSSLSALGQGGGSIGYADGGSPCDDGVTPPPCGGIPNSLAIEFDTFNNGSATGDPNGDHIAVQSCGIGQPNSPGHSTSNDFNFPNCLIGDEVSTPSTTMSDGQVHTVVIDYTPPACAGECSGTLTVNLDGSIVLTTSVTLENELSLNAGGKAWVGFTAATGAADENHDILSWTLSPSQTKTVSAGGDGTVFNFGAYDYTAKLNTGSDVQVQVTPVLKSQAECSALIQPTFPGAQCFVYNNVDGLGGKSAVMFEVTCPDSSDNVCGSITLPFDAELGSDYSFEKSANPNYRGPSGTGNPLPGWLKGHPIDTIHPCNPNPSNTPPLFQSDQIESFVVVGDPTATTKGGSGGTGSCWVATYNTPGVAPPMPTVVIPVNNANYPQGASVASSFTCSAINAGSVSLIGPYLTVPTTPTPGCTASVDGGAPITSGTLIPTTPGTHTFVATVIDSGSDTTSKTVTYNVVGPTDVAILKVGPSKAPVNSKVTYIIGVGDTGSQPAVDVNVIDVLPAGTTFSSVSANKVSCSIVNRRLTCSTTTIPCTTGSTVSCAVGTLQPLSLSSLNGATIQLTVQLGPSLTAGKTVKNTATVSSTNTDTHTGNNSSTASTLLTAH